MNKRLVRRKKPAEEPAKVDKVALEAAILELSKLTAAHKAATKKFKADEESLKAIVIDNLPKLSKDNPAYEILDADGDRLAGVKVIYGSRTTLDHEKLRKKIPAKTWKSITKSTLDTALLESACADPDSGVDMVTVGLCTEVTQNKPYLKW